MTKAKNIKNLRTYLGEAKRYGTLEVFFGEQMTISF